MDVIRQLEQEEIKRLGKEIPVFAPGDTVIVNVNVKEGDRKRLQAYEGVVIAKRNRGLNSSFTVRKVSSGEGVERTFQTYSPLIASVEVKRKGDVRRAKLYYLRDRSGKGARIREKLAKHVEGDGGRRRVAAAMQTTKGASAPFFCCGPALSWSPDLWEARSCHESVQPRRRDLRHGSRDFGAALLRQFLDEPLEERLAARDLVERDELVRLVRLLDRARPADDRRDAGLLEEPRLGRVGDLGRRRGCGTAPGRAPSPCRPRRCRGPGSGPW